jgi:hypothetical protein
MKSFSLNDIKGVYTFQFSGGIINGPVVSAIGILKADGKGNVTDSVRKLNLDGQLFTQAFEGTYSIDPNGLGSSRFRLVPPNPNFPQLETFEFVAQEGGKELRFVGSTPGFVLSGVAERQ